MQGIQGMMGMIWCTARFELNNDGALSATAANRENTAPFICTVWITFLAARGVYIY